MKIRYQLLLGYLFISLFGGVAGYIGIKAVKEIQQGFDRVINETIPVKTELNDIQRSINDLVIRTNEIILLRQRQHNNHQNIQDRLLVTAIAKEINAYHSSEHDFLISYHKYEKLALTFFPEERDFLRSIKISSQKTLQISEDLISLQKQDRYNTSAIFKQRDLNQANEEFNQAIAAALIHEDFELNDRKNDLDTTLKRYENIIFAFTIFGLLLSITIALLISRYILAALNKLKVAIIQIGLGDLDTRIENFTNDEFGLFATRFNKMAEDLQQSTAYLQQAQKDNALLATAIEYVTDAIEITDRDGHFIYVNPAFTKMTGYTLQEAIGKTPAELFRGGQHSNDFYEEMARAVKQGEIWHGLLIGRRKDGTFYDQEMTISPLSNQKGSHNNIVAVRRDISDRLKAEQALQKSEERLELVLWGSKDGFWDWNVQTNRIFYSTRWKEMRGFGEHEIGTDPDECIKRVHPDDLDGFTQALQDHLAKKTATFAIEYRTLCKDGSYIWVFDRAQAFWDEAGNPVRMAGSETDITQQKQVEATLREAERRWRSLLENVQMVVVSLDRFGRVDYVNPFFLELTGYRQEEVIGKDWFTNLIPHEQTDRVQQSFLDILEYHFHPYYKNSILTKYHQERSIAWNNTLLHNTQDEIVGTMSIGQDITERQRMERTKDEFISVVSHELRTPLASIQGGLNLISTGLIDPHSEKGRQTIEIVAENADRLVLLVNDILELERLKLGKVKLLKKSCNTADLILKAIDMLQVIANRSQIKLSFTPQAIQVSADPDRIIQVLTNLLSNAIKFSPQGSTVWLTVELQEASKKALFKVKDEGRGIPGDKLNSIFERFQQVDASDSRKKGGTGLGLAICRSIVEQHLEEIWVESILEQGSIFCFTLPVILED